MKRREFLCALGSATAAWPVRAQAQPAERVRRVGMLLPMAEDDPEGLRRAASIREGLKQHGWIAGRNLQIEYRWSSGHPARMNAHAVELAAMKPDVIIASATNPLAALQRATSTIPIVFAQVIDPVGGGYVASLARPGGNITGFSNFEYGVAAKWVELLKQIAPTVTHIGVLYESASRLAGALLKEIEASATTFGVKLSAYGVQDRAEIDRSVETFAREPSGGMIGLSSPFMVTNRDAFIAAALRHRIPTVYPFRYFAVSGGLASYGIDNHDLYKRAASYVDRILRGEKPGDLPVQQATKFELVINLKTAKALGLDVPVSLLARTDEVIE